MSKASFTIVYDGPALIDGSMDVKDVAPALLALGELFDATNQVLNEDRAAISVRAKLGPEKGSFPISIEVIQSLLDRLKDLFHESPLTTASEIATILGFVGGVTYYSVLKLIKFAKGRKPKKVVEIDDGKIQLSFEYDPPVNVEQKVFKVYNAPPVRQALEDVVRPLKEEGVDEIRAETDDKVFDIIESAEFEYFKAPILEGEIISESEAIMTLTIHSLVFPGEKWRLSDGTTTFWVKIVDEKFLQEINDNIISFCKGDILRARIKIVQKKADGKLHTEYEAIEILEHEKPAIQLSLKQEEEEE